MGSRRCSRALALFAGGIIAHGSVRMARSSSAVMSECLVEARVCSFRVLLDQRAARWSEASRLASNLTASLPTSPRLK